MSKTILHPSKHFAKRACELGAKEAKIISPQVFTAEWVRRKCQYGCDGYGVRLTCYLSTLFTDPTRNATDA